MLYKYLSPDRIDVLDNSAIRFTPYTQLNDPFECRFTLNPIEREADKALEDNYLAEWALVEVWLESRVGQLGMLSLSHTFRNILMWSHYANEHRGFVIGLDENHSFFQKEAYYIDPEYRYRQDLFFPGFGTIRDVRYTQERPNIDFGGNMNFDALFTKSLDWNYEQEARIFRNLTEADNVIGDQWEGIHLFRIPEGVICKIIIGAQASKSLEEKVEAAVLKGNLVNVSVEKAKLDRRNYSLDFEKVNMRKA